MGKSTYIITSESSTESVIWRRFYNEMRARGLTSSVTDFSIRWCGLSANYFHENARQMEAGRLERIPQGGYLFLWNRLLRQGHYDLASEVFSVLTRDFPVDREVNFDKKRSRSNNGSILAKSTRGGDGSAQADTSGEESLISTQVDHESKLRE